MSGSIPVLLGRCDTYDPQRLAELFDRFAAHWSLPESLSGRTVLLKPNLVSAWAPPLACTDRRFLRVLAQWFCDRGARLLLGDSPSFGSAAQVLHKQGITAECAGLELRVVEFKTARPVRLAHGVTIGIAEEALACDLFVNVPRIKAHSQMYLTAAVKNLFGIVCGTRKAAAHMKNGLSHHRFADLMLDLIELLPQHLSVVDGIEVMHRQGPARGDALQVGCVAAGHQPVAIDCALIEALELEHERCPIAVRARRRDMPGSRVSELLFPGDQPAAFHGSGFVAPVHLHPVPFHPLRFLVSSVRRLVGGLRR